MSNNDLVNQLININKRYNFNKNIRDIKGLKKNISELRLLLNKMIIELTNTHQLITTDINQNITTNMKEEINKRSQDYFYTFSFEKLISSVKSLVNEYDKEINSIQYNNKELFTNYHVGGSNQLTKKDIQSFFRILNIIGKNPTTNLPLSNYIKNTPQRLNNLTQLNKVPYESSTMSDSINTFTNNSMSDSINTFTNNSMSDSINSILSKLTSETPSMSPTMSMSPSMSMSPTASIFPTILMSPKLESFTQRVPATSATSTISVIPNTASENDHSFYSSLSDYLNESYTDKDPSFSISNASNPNNSLLNLSTNSEIYQLDKPTNNNDMTLLFQDKQVPVSSQIKSMWKQLEKKYNNKNNIFVKVNRHQEPNIFENFNVKNTPTLMKIRNGTPSQYSGNYNMSDLKQFVNDYNTNSNSTEELDFENNGTLTYYTNPKCPFCQRFDPTWESLRNGNNEANMMNTVKLLKVDCLTDPETCRNNNIKAYPSIQFKKSNQDSPIEFEGARTLDKLVHFVNSNTSKQNESIVSSDKDITEFNKSVIVLLYADWCRYSQKFINTWNELRKVVNDSDVEFVKIDLSDKSLWDKYQVKTVPTLELIKNNKRYRFMSSNRSIPNLTRFISNPDSGLSQHGGKNKSSVKLMKFHVNWCGHCRDFAPEWEKLKKVMKDDNIEFVDIDGDDEKNKDLIKQYGIEGYPTIKLVVDDNMVDYHGERSVNELVNFIKFHI